MTTITYETVTFDWFLRAELGSISSSRCQITRARRHEAERTRIDFLWTRCPRTVFANLFQDLRSLAVCVVACRPKLRSSEGWWSQTGSNRRPHACKARALPAELWPRNCCPHTTGKPDAADRYAERSNWWWAWEDLNFRPHAYQARALTN